MSDTPMDTPVETRGAQSKVAKPDLFYGDRAKLEDWLLQFDLYFKFAGDSVEDEDRATLAASYLRGPAAKWNRPYLMKYLDEDNNEREITRMFEEWPEYKEKLRQAFAIPNEPAIAERAIQNLRQTRSAGDYANLFQQYATNTEWNDKALMRMFRQGLKDSVKKELMRSGARINTVNDLITEAIRLDNELYELSQETRGEPKPRAHNEQRNHRSNTSQRRGQRNHRSNGIYASTGLEDMHLDNVNKDKRNSKKHQRSKEGITCYGCGKKGHMARDCRQKNKVIRQVNMLRIDQNDDSAWEVVSSPQTPDHGPPQVPVSPRDTEESYKTKQQKENEFQAINRPATPYPVEDSPEQYYGYTFTGPTVYLDRLYIHTRLHTLIEGLSRQFLFTHYVQMIENGWTAGEVWRTLHCEECNQTYRTPRAVRRLRGAQAALLRMVQREEDVDLIQALPTEIGHDGQYVYGLAQEIDADTCDGLTEYVKEWEEFEGEEKTQTVRYVDDQYEFHYEQVRKNGTFPHQLGMGEDEPREPSEEPRELNMLHQEDCEQPEQEDALQQLLDPMTWVLSNHEDKENLDPQNYTPTPPTTPDEVEIEIEDSYFALDPLHPKHHKLAWTSCYDNNCQAHLMFKIHDDLWPDQGWTCKWQWFDCPTHHCAVHLRQKRAAQYFYGLSGEDIIVMRMTIYGSCTQKQWWMCLACDCKKHADEKIAQGYVSEAFLGKRLKPPTLSPLRN